MNKTLVWLERISEDNKKGLRVISKIMEVDGRKRFKLDGLAVAANNTAAPRDLSLKDVYNVPYDEAQKAFRKMTNSTQYASFFGSKPPEAGDYEILKYKKFSQLKISHILKPHVVATVERWLGIND